MGEEDDTEEDDEETPQNRDDFSTEKIPCVSPLRQSTSAYSQFINRIVNDAVVVLWPENTAMVLARFLANYHQYSALQVPIFSFFFFNLLKGSKLVDYLFQAYCQLNEPYVTELCAAFRFFEGYALAGLGDPEKVLFRYATFRYLV